MYPRTFVWRNPPSNTSTQLSWTYFPLHPNSILFCKTLTIVISPHNYHFSFFAGRKTRGKSHRPLACYSPQPDYPHGIISPHLIITPLQYNHQVAPYHAIMCCRKPTEECFPCVAQNIISVHSPCSPFTVYASRPGHSTPSRRWSQYNNIHLPAWKLLHHRLHFPQLSQTPLRVSGC